MKILIAPDKFKGTLSAREVAEAIATGLREILPDTEIEIVPMADGGEGTAEAISQALGAKWVECKSHDPLGRQIEASYGWIDDRKLAVMEMSEAAGMRRLRPNELNPEIATTFGVGEMILGATKRGANEIIIGLGGSATNDGGTGMARAFGFNFFNGEQELKGTVVELEKLTHIEVLSAAVSRLPLAGGEGKGEGKPKIIAAVDVRNPLLGDNGATRVFGPQKGVTPDKIDKFERALTKLADVVAKEFGFDYRNEPGAGAAGGLGFGLMSFCSAKITPGFKVVSDSVGLERKMNDADVVITGEGSLDRQTLEGKTPAGVAHLARKLGKRVIAFVGRDAGDPGAHQLFDSIYHNARPGMSTEENMKRAAELLQDNARQLAKELKKTTRRKRQSVDARSSNGIF
ncbi:MAG TPA: glycerate kinase [Chthoniobacterales bacterium]|nr:glycerate kinase [Chthoniobacterales bacterium]